jgi:hypothetical protein
VKRAIKVQCCTVLLSALWLMMAPLLHAQKGAGGDLAKQTQQILDTYGLEQPAKAGAVLLRHLIEGKKDKAYGVFELKDPIKRSLEKSEDLKFLKARAADVASVDFVGYRLISTDILSLLYVLMTRDGPVVVRLDFYSFDKKLHMIQMRTARQWDEMMQLIDSVRELPASLEFKIESKDDKDDPEPSKLLRPSKTDA